MKFRSFHSSKWLVLGSFTLAMATGITASAQTANDGKRSALSGAEITYLEQVAKENLGEIVMSYLAIEKSASEDVKSYARELISTHGKTMQQLMEIASKHDAFIALQPDLSSYQKLLSHGGTDFDKVYAAEAQRINQEAIDSLNRVMSQLTDSDVKGFAQDDLKDDKEHLKKAQEIAGKLK